MRLPFAFALLCLLSATAAAQDHFEPAIVVLRNGDTLSGFVDDRNWRSTPDKIQYKSGLTGGVVEYSSTDLQSFEFSGAERYVTRHAILHYYTDDLRELEDQMDTLTHHGPLLFQVLFSGAANLLLYVDERFHNHFFIETDKHAPDELVLKKSIMKSQDPGNSAGAMPAVTTSKKYKQSLTYYFADCPELKSSINSCGFTENALVKLFEAYSACRKVAGMKFQQKHQQAKFSCAVLAGVSATTLNLSTDIWYLSYYDQQDYNYSVQPALGLRLFIELPRNNRTWALVNDLLFTAYKVTGTAQYDSALITSSFDMSYMNIQTQLHFDFSSNEIRPYGKFGMSNGFMLNNSAHMTVETSGGNSSHSDTRFSGSSLRSYEAALLMSMGIRNSRIQAEVTWKRGNGFSKISALGTGTNSWTLLVGYIF